MLGFQRFWNVATLPFHLPEADRISMQPSNFPDPLPIAQQVAESLPLSATTRRRRQQSAEWM
jgi:hypothetical protein